MVLQIYYMYKGVVYHNIDYEISFNSCSESCALTFADQMPKEKEREPHVRGLFDLRILP